MCPGLSILFGAVNSADMHLPENTARDFYPYGFSDGQIRVQCVANLVRLAEVVNCIQTVAVCAHNGRVKGLVVF